MSKKLWSFNKDVSSCTNEGICFTTVYHLNCFECVTFFLKQKLYIIEKLIKIKFYLKNITKSIFIVNITITLIYKTRSIQTAVTRICKTLTMIRSMPYVIRNYFTINILFQESTESTKITI